MSNQNITIKLPESNENFSVWTHADKPWRLVKPQGIKQRWKKPELWWRSMITDPNGMVLSAGLMKFKNYSEDLEHKAQLHKALASGETVLFSEKLDGSLGIRSVIDGEVIWRTRGSFGDEPYEIQTNMREHASLYPLLMDPTYRPDESLHFEFCHPDHRVIIAHDEPSLTLISGVRHSDLVLHTFDELRKISEEVGVPLVNLHQLPSDPAKLLDTVAKMRGMEGVVVRINNEQTYIKVKSAEYLAQHRLKSGFTPERALKLCQEFDFATADEFIDHLFSLGMDWEVASERVRWWYLYQEVKSSVNEIMADVRIFLSTYEDLYESNRGEFARLVQDGYDDQRIRTLCFTVASGKVSIEDGERNFFDLILKSSSGKSAAS